MAEATFVPVGILHGQPVERVKGQNGLWCYRNSLGKRVTKGTETIIPIPRREVQSLVASLPMPVVEPVVAPPVEVIPVGETVELPAEIAFVAIAARFSPMRKHYTRRGHQARSFFDRTTGTYKIWLHVKTPRGHERQWVEIPETFTLLKTNDPTK